MASKTNPRSPLCSAWREHYPTCPPTPPTLCAAMLPVYDCGSFTPAWPWVLSTGMDMGALTAPRCTTPFKRQCSASLTPLLFATGLVQAHCPGLAGRLTKAEAQMSEVEKAPWCTVPKLCSMAQHLSHLLAPNLPRLAPPPPPASLTSTLCILKFFSSILSSCRRR